MEAATQGNGAPLPVRVSTRSFTALSDGEQLPLAIDAYQRGFVWDDARIAQLVDDLAQHRRASDPKPPYYMGSILLHLDAGKRSRFVIDGQQRLTALCILHHQLAGRLPRSCALAYSPQSERRILGASRVFQREAHRLTASILHHVEFTVIEVDDVDLAFTFFDTQNNRGVPLHATDLLKAYHLRAVSAAPGSTQRLEALCADRWERVQQGRAVMSHEEEFTASLFTRFLWRSRQWTGTGTPAATHDALLAEFEKGTLASEGDAATVPLYRARLNRHADAMTLRSDETPELQPVAVAPSPRASDLPFAIRQPVHSGVGFFLYTDKYASLLRMLMTEAAPSEEVEKVRALYRDLVSRSSAYLREIYLLMLLMYADAFGEQRLYEFALWLEHAIGVLRLQKMQVRRETAEHFFTKTPSNLLDRLAAAFTPRELIQLLQQQGYARPDVYAGEQIDIKSNGVRATYKKAALRYFEQEGSLAHKAVWIRRRLEQDA